MGLLYHENTIGFLLGFTDFRGYTGKIDEKIPVNCFSDLRSSTSPSFFCDTLFLFPFSVVQAPLVHADAFIAFQSGAAAQAGSQFSCQSASGEVCEHTVAHKSFAVFLGGGRGQADKGRRAR